MLFQRKRGPASLVVDIIPLFWLQLADPALVAPAEAALPAQSASMAADLSTVWENVAAEAHDDALRLISTMEAASADATETDSILASALRAKALVHSCRGELGLALASEKASLLADPIGWAAPATWSHYATLAGALGEHRDVVETGASLLSRNDLGHGMRSQVAFFVARAFDALGEEDRAAAAYRDLGFADAWSVIGPFSGIAGSGFDRVFGVENELGSTSLYADDWGVEREWRNIERHSDAWVSLSHLYPTAEASVFFARTHLHTSGGAAYMNIGVGGAIKVWLNGELVVSESEPRLLLHDLYGTNVTLSAGWNTIVIKVQTNEDMDAGFSLRVSGKDGAILEGLRWAAIAPAEIARENVIAGERGPTTSCKWWVYEQVKSHFQESPSLDAAVLVASMADYGDFEPGFLREVRDSVRRFDSSSVLMDQLSDVYRAAKMPHASHDLANGARAHNESNISGIAQVIGELTSSTEDRAAAIRLLESYVAEHPASTVAQQMLIEEFVAADRISDAYAAVDRLADLAPRAPGTVLRTAWKLGRTEGSAAVAQHVADAWRANQTDLTITSLLLASFGSTGDLDGLRRFLEERATLQPYCPVWHQLLIEMDLREGHMERAWSRAQEALRITPDDPSIFGAAAQAAEGVGQLARAQTLYEKTLTAQPDQWSLRNRVMGLTHARGWGDLFVSETTDSLIAADRIAPAYPDEHAYYLLDDCQRLVLDDYATKVTYRVVGCVNDALGVEALKQCAVRPTSNAFSFEIAQISTIKPDGRVLKGENSDDGIVLSGLAPGDYFEVSYTVYVSCMTAMGRAVWQGQVLYHTEHPKVMARIQLVRPGELALATQCSPNVNVTEATLRDGFVRTIWSAEQVPAVGLPEGTPIAAAFDYFVDFSSVLDWKAIGEWYERQTFRHPQASVTVEEKARSLVQGIENPREQALILSRFVARHITYSQPQFQIEPVTPTDPATVLERGIGDCKDQCALLVAMARAVGLEASMALVNTQVGRDYPYLPSIRFDHVVAVLWVPGGDLWVDPTQSYHDPLSVPVSLEGARVLLLDGEESRLTRVPLVSEDASGLRIRTKFVLDEGGPGTQESTIDLRGQEAASLMAALAPASDRDRKETIQRWLEPGSGQFVVTDAVLTDIDETSDSVRVEVSGERSLGFLTFGDQQAIEAPFQTSRFGALLPTAQKFSHGLDLTWWKGTCSETVAIHLPASMAVEALPKSVLIEIPEAQYRFAASLSPSGELVFERDLTIRVLEVPADRCAEFQEFLAEIAKADRSVATLENSAAAERTTAFSLE